MEKVLKVGDFVESINLLKINEGNRVYKYKGIIVDFYPDVYRNRLALVEQKNALRELIPIDYLKPYKGEGEKFEPIYTKLKISEDVKAKLKFDNGSYKIIKGILAEIIPGKESESYSLCTQAIIIEGELEFDDKNHKKFKKILDYMLSDKRGYGIFSLPKSIQFNGKYIGIEHCALSYVYPAKFSSEEIDF